MFSYRGIYKLFPLVFILILNGAYVQGQGENHVDNSSSVLDISPPDNVPVCGHVSRMNRAMRPVMSNDRKADINEWPWMALLGEKMINGMNWFCGGVLINSKWILSAAHCTDRRNAHWVRLGELNYSDPDDGAQHMDVAIARIIYHEGFKLPQGYHDLSLIELDTKINFTDGISPVCLPWGEEGKKNLIGQSFFVTGWGAQYYNGPPVDILMVASLKVFSNERCIESYSRLIDYMYVYPEGINQKILCVGDDTLQGGGTCMGDSGGPGVYKDPNGRYFLGGIVSTGYGCGKNAFPTIQSKVAHPQNLAWIKKHAFT